MRVEVVLGLGSNFGDRQDFLKQAIIHIENELLLDVRQSHLYESQALLPDIVQFDWDLPYLNMALSGRLKHVVANEFELLEKIKQIEAVIGRIDRGRWGPREIDIDILAYGSKKVATEKLHIPHKELLNRDFALVPFMDVYPDWRYVGAGKYFRKTVKEIVGDLDYGSEISRVSWDS